MEVSNIENRANEKLRKLAFQFLRFRKKDVKKIYRCRSTIISL